MTWMQQEKARSRLGRASAAGEKTVVSIPAGDPAKMAAALTEALDLTTPAGRAMAGLLAVFAAFEREVLGERVRAGLAHARQNGKRLGRPATATMHADRVRKLRRSGLSKSEIARRLNIGRTSVRRILDERT